jgi:hypothetical protein
LDGTKNSYVRLFFISVAALPVSAPPGSTILPLPSLPVENDDYATHIVANQLLHLPVGGVVLPINWNMLWYSVSVFPGLRGKLL